MNCPYCNKEMRSGCFVCMRGLSWRENMERGGLLVNEEAGEFYIIPPVKINEPTLVNTESSYCPDCNVVLMTDARKEEKQRRETLDIMDRAMERIWWGKKK